MIPLTPLRVETAGEIARGIRAFELRHPDGEALPAFTPGAHVSVQTPHGALRKYSLCNDPAERDRYLIAVKREPAGRGGSASMVDRVRAGDLLAVSAPENAFELSQKATRFIFIAGGIGITPILSMVRHLGSGGGGTFKLFYLTRSPDTTAFLSELQNFKSQTVIHHDGGDPQRMFDLWPALEKPSAAHVYCCGPRALMDAVRDMTGHWPAAAIHFESFLDSTATLKADDHKFRVRLARSDEIVEIPADRTILDVLREKGKDIPSSCESGTCGTCRTRLLAGEAEHRDLILSGADQAQNIMVCVSRARSEELVLDL